MSRLDDLKAQLAELDTLVRNGTLTGEAARAARDRLEAEVLQQVAPSAGAAVADAPRPSGRLLAAVCAFVLLFGGAGYLSRGNLPGWSVAPGEAPPASAEGGGHATDTAQFEALAAKLAERLKANPNDAKGWSMLGRSYAVLGKNDLAVQAYQRLVELQPNDAQALADYADALATANGRKLEGEPEKLIDRALKADPDHPKSLALAGTIAFNRNDYAVAARHWERAMRGIDPETPLGQQLRGAIDEARQRAGLPPLAAASAPGATVAAAATAPAVAASGASPVAAASGASLQVRVSLDPALAAKAEPGDTVFVFARAPTGSKMPLAIQRRQVKDLPLELTLDDSSAMSPATRLSTAREVVVGARISKRGDAMPQPGDLQGLSGTVAVGSAGPVQVRIGEVVP